MNGAMSMSDKLLSLVFYTALFRMAMSAVTCRQDAESLWRIVFTVICPSGCRNDDKKVWGTDIYTSDSSICKAAIHAGVITNNGGSVIVQKVTGLNSYKGSERNGITARGWNDYYDAFKVFAVITTTTSTTRSTIRPTSTISSTTRQSSTRQSTTNLSQSNQTFSTQASVPQSNAQTFNSVSSTLQTFNASLLTSQPINDTSQNGGKVEGNSLDTTRLAAGLVSGAVAIVLLICLALLIIRRHKRQKLSAKTETPISNATQNHREVVNNVLYTSYDNELATENENTYQVVDNVVENENHAVYEVPERTSEKEEVDNILYGDTKVSDQKEEVVNPLYDL